MEPPAKDRPAAPAGGWSADVVAGLVTSAVVIPKAMAFATIAGLPVQVGLYTGLVPLVVYALLGTSRPLSVSSTTTIAILSAANLSAVPPAELVPAAATLAVLVGAILALAAVLRLGFVANFISEPVLTGFKTGIGLVIVADQLPKLLGVHITKAGYFRDLLAVAEQVPHASGATVGVSAATVLLIGLLHRFAPKLPAPLVAVGAGIAACRLLGLEALGVSTVGAVPQGLPAPVWPRLGLVESLWPGAVGIALMSFTESIAAARAFAERGEPRPQPNRELLALGAANAAGGLLGAMPAGGGTSQTAVNRSAGARSQLAGLITAGVSLLTLLLLAPVIGWMPNAVLAAVVVVYSVGLIQPGEFRAILRVRAIEFRWALIACGGVMVLGTLQGIVVAVVASLLSIAWQTYAPVVHVLGRKRGTDVFRPRSDEHPDDETWPGLLILHPTGRIFFSNAERVGETMRAHLEAASPRVVLIDFSAVVDLEYTALKMLTAAEEELRARGVLLWLAGLDPEVLEMVRRSALGETLGRERMFFNVQQAVERWERDGGAPAGAPVTGNPTTGAGA